MKTKLLLFISASLCGQIAFAQTVQLFGTALSGGNSNYGSLYSINSDGSGFNVNYIMVKSQGANPYGGVLEASDHLLYGIDARGGANDTGAIFSYDPSTSTYTDLFDFQLSTGALPVCGSLTEASNGKLYGMAAVGGANDSGAIFSFDPSNDHYTDVHDFAGSDGATPQYCSLLLASDGNLYGAASNGGTGNAGVLFKFNPSNNQYTVLHKFTGADGGFPLTSLVQVGSNKIYGTTSSGGADTLGVIFSYNFSTNSYADVHDFTHAEGQTPYGGLLLASDGKLYGTTSFGGTNSGGVIFNLNSSSNQYTEIYNFDAGSFPAGPFIEYPAGTLLATTDLGGAHDSGMIYSFDLSNNLLTDFHDFNGGDGVAPGVGGLTLYSPTLGVSPLNTVHFIISPVPSTGTITVNCPSRMDEVKVTDVLGRAVEDIRPYQTQWTLRIDEAGVYFVSVKSGNKTGIEKVIVYK